MSLVSGDSQKNMNEIEGVGVFANWSEKTPKRCKIIGTLGPSSSDKETIKKLVLSGLDIFRLNFSHGDHETHLANIARIREASKELNQNISILQDLQGPKIRCGHLINDQLSIEAGKTYRLEFGTKQVDPNVIPIDYRELVHDVKIGHRVMMDDGLLIFKIVDIQAQTVHVEAVESGLLKNRKGVNFPDSLLSLPALTEKDSRDLLFGVANRIDYIALSFVQRAADVEQVKSMIKALGADTPVVAKIEKISAVEDIDAIAQATDALMVARGDLGVEASVEKVPSFQRKILKAGAKYNKPVIIATQMLESMIHNPRSTLAETADVANGVLEGADCLMLSGEVAAGKYPVQSVAKMSEIIRQVENAVVGADSFTSSRLVEEPEQWQVHETIAKAACEAAKALDASAIVCLTLTGNIATTIARWRPEVPIIAISPRRDVVHRMSMVWGVYGILNPLFYNTDVLLQNLPDLLKRLKVVDVGEIVVITAGIPINKMCATNMVKINRIS